MADKFRKDFDYKKVIKLKHDEIPATVNVDTGKITPIEYKGKYTDDPRFEKFDHNAYFQQHYTEAWDLLKTQTTKTEFLVACELGRRAKAFTNSLEPLNQDTTFTELAEIFDINRNTAKAIFEKLFKLGVYARWEVSESDDAKVYKHQKYWVFNPYLSFNGKVQVMGLSALFKDTIYAKLTRS